MVTSALDSAACAAVVALEAAGMPTLPPDPDYPDSAAFAAEVAAWAAIGYPEADPGDELDEADLAPYAPGPVSRVELLEWQVCGADERDEAEAAMLALRAPAWVRLPPGGALATALEDLRPSVESPVALIEAMKACDREIAWLESVKLAAIASFSRQREHEAATEPYARHVDDLTGRPMDPERSCAAELAAALKVSPNTIGSRIRAARRLTAGLRETYQALRCGSITLSKTLAVLNATEHLPPDAQRNVETRVLPRAPEQTHALLRAALRRAVARVDTRNQASRHRDALSERVCRVHDLPDGMAGLWLTHSADKIQALWIAVRALADRARSADPDGTRTAEQRRADVMVDVFGQILANGTDWLNRPLPVQQRRRPHVEVTVPATTLLGLDDQPADLAGYGPITAELARRIAAEGTWRRLLTDPATGIVLEAATTRHDPPAQVSETLLARHPVCDWIGCNRPARECDRDHGTKFRTTGTTRLTDLRNYCEYHHVIKDNDHWGWQVHNQPDGTTRLTAPTGHVYTTAPPARGLITDHTTSPNHPGSGRTALLDRDPDPPPF